MTGMCGEHEGRVSIAIAGIHICTLSKEIKDDRDVTTLDRILPGGIHQSIKDSLVTASLRCDPACAVKCRKAAGIWVLASAQDRKPLLHRRDLGRLDRKSVV